MKGTGKVMTIAVLSGAILIFILEGLPLIRNRQCKEFAFMEILTVAALLLVIGKAAGIPTPASMLDKWLKPLGEIILR